MKNISLICIFMMVYYGLQAQQTDIQYDYDFSIHNDYDNYNSTIIDIVNWMQNTSLDDRKDQREKYQTFLLNWIAGHPRVKVLLNEWTNATEIGDKNPILLIIFIGAWAKESLETEKYDDLTKLHLASIKAVSRFYSENREYMRKDRCVEKYIRLEKKEKLETWIRKRIE